MFAAVAPIAAGVTRSLSQLMRIAAAAEAGPGPSDGTATLSAGLFNGPGRLWR